MTLATAAAQGVSSAAGVLKDPAALSLPSLRLPYGFPAYMRDEHGIDMLPIFGDQPMQTGSARRRRIYLTAPQTADVALELNICQAQQFYDWWEGPMRAGDNFFAAEVAQPAPGTLWWKARPLGVYKSKYLGGQWWQINMKLMLFGTPAQTGPELSDLRGGIEFDLRGSADLSVGNPLTGGVSFNVVPNTVISFLTGAVVFDIQPATYRDPPSVGAATGTSTVLGGGQTNVISGYANGNANVTGVGRTIKFATGAASGTSTAAALRAVLQSTGSAVGTSIGNFKMVFNGYVGQSTNGAVAQATAIIRGLATGVSTVSAVGVRAAVGVGAATGTSTASALRAGNIGIAAGVAVASAVGTKLYRATGAASGAATVSALPATIRGTGAATGTGAASGVGQPALRSVGSATGTSTVSGVPPAPTLSWTASTLPVSLGVTGIEHNGSQFLITSGSDFLTSTDGLSWTDNPAPTIAFQNFGWCRPVWSNTLSLWCSIGYTASKAITSPDGVNWTLRTLPAISGNWVLAATDGVGFMLLADSGETAWTTDASTWTVGTTLTSFGGAGSIACNPVGHTICVADYNKYAHVTSDLGVTWTRTALPTTSDTYGNIIWNGNVYFTVASNGSTAGSSPDGVTWTTRSPGSGNYYEQGRMGTTLVLLKNGTNVARVSTDDGATWSSETLPASKNWGPYGGSSSRLIALTYDGNDYFAYRS